MNKVRVGENIKIYQDGKVCRDIPATVLGYRAGGVKVRFTVDAGEPDEEVITVWCRRRRRCGVYEAHEWNYWIIPHSWTNKRFYDEC